MQAEYNATAWGHESILHFFDKHCFKTSDIYSSEWFFIQQKLHEGMSVLDIGCAKGGMSNVLSEHLKTFNYVGIDINSKMIDAAQKRYPQHQFYHVDEHAYSALNNKTFDLVLCLGILHLHETWRNTIKLAWAHTKSHLILDLRETHLATIENKNISFMRMNFDEPDMSSPYQLPYNIINAADALEIIFDGCAGAKNISHYGYTHPVSHLAISPYSNVMANVYCIER